MPNTGGIGLHATLLVTKSLLVAGEGWGGDQVVRAYDKKTGAVLREVNIPGMMGSQWPSTVPDHDCIGTGASADMILQAGPHTREWPLRTHGYTSAVNLKFLSLLLQARVGTSNSKTALESKSC